MNARSAWLSPTGQTREDTRVTQLGAVTPADNIEGRSGILPGSPTGAARITGFALTGATGGMTATIGTGRAIVQAASARGAYPVAVTEPITLTFDNGQEYARKDLVVLRIYDDQYDASGRTEAVVEVVKGTPAATSPVPPATPATALPLYAVNVPANAGAGSGGLTWLVDDLRTSIVAVGGILPTYGETGNGAYPGQYRDTATALQRWNGTVWIPYPREPGGIAPGGALTNGSYAGQYRDSPNGQLQRWNGTAWAPAVPGPVFVDTLTTGSTTSTAYTATLVQTPATPLTLSFTAPASGGVLLSHGTRMLTVGSTTTNAFMAPQVTQGSTVVLPVQDDRAVMGGGTLAMSLTATMRLGSLTAGATYTVTAMYRSSNASVACTFDNMWLRVDPMA
ncbi:hypothetical protein ACFYXF_25240 [Streptomyces sp. NPDC002680]|uniref:hypothetical protein n=1 Tax=Streptomyces sp. NPDC002680 TaxID=3364659 RepID=UPI0036CFF229